MGERFASRYLLVDEIGHGTFGVVYRAWDEREHRYVAAKMLQQSQAHTLLRFVREGILRIDHPHVVAPTGWAAADDKVLLTMDLVSGGSVANLVGDYGPLPASYVATLLDQLLDGLDAVHGQQVVHRDIKPANILLEATGTRPPRLRLSDFGLALHRDDIRMTDLHQVIGTPGYMAPEQYDGADPDRRTDLFAVGLVALYLLQGEQPDAPELAKQFAASGATPTAPPGVAEPLWPLIASLLHPDPHARCATAADALTMLQRIIPLLPEPGSDGLIEVFNQLPLLPTGFGSDGPAATHPAPSAGAATTTRDTAQLRLPTVAPQAPVVRPGEDPAPERNVPPAQSPALSRPAGLPAGTGLLTLLGVICLCVGIWAWTQI
ncbi:protein kinase [Streptomyces sp. T-3]|nr:protein kinase [Streptomyces sp. T-3]